MSDKEFQESLSRIHYAVIKLREELKTDIEKTKLDIMPIVRMHQDPSIQSLAMSWLAIDSEGKKVIKDRFPPPEKNSRQETEGSEGIRLETFPDWTDLRE